MTAKRGQARAIGPRIIRAMEIVEQIGPTRGMVLQHHMPEVPNIDGVGKLLRVAVSYGLAERIETRPATYRTVKNWRSVLETPVKCSGDSWRGISSVWGFAAKT